MTVQPIADRLYSEKPEGVLYHYTSLGAAMKIVDSHVLYATEVRFLNDAAEMKHLVDLLAPVIGQIEETQTSTDRLRLFTQLKAWLAHRVADGNMVHVTCFTQRGNLLSQWRSYCPPAKGVSLGFSAPELLKSTTEQSFQFGKCLYDTNQQVKIAAELVEAIEGLAQKRGENTNTSKRHPSNSYHDVFEEIESDLLRIAVLLKHPSFHEEQEWRIVSRVMTNYVTEPIKYREGSSMLVPYIEFFLPRSTDRQVDLEHVVLGPTPNQNISMNALSRFLTKHSASPRSGVSYCGIPYRTW